MQLSITALLALLCLFSPAPARAGDNPLLGTWRLKSFVREVAGTGERYNQLGERPDGYLSYAADGRMLVLFVSDEQPRPRAEPTDDERIKLHKTMLAYGGTYTRSPGKVVHHLDIEWDGRRLGTDQVRFYTIDGDKLLLKTEPNATFGPGPPERAVDLLPPTATLQLVYLDNERAMSPR
jgi:Lipocalin-like domain